MNQTQPCCRGSLICAAVLIALCASAMGAASSVVDVNVAEIVAVAMRPIA